MHARRNQGYTLMELMMAIVVLLIAMVAIMGVLTAAVVAHQKAVSRRAALNAATAQIEELRRVPVPDLTSGTFDVEGLANSAGPVGAVTVTPTASSSMSVVTVTVEWDRPGYGQLELETIVSQ